MLRSLRNLNRLYTIARVLARHDALDAVDLPLAQLAAKALRLGRDSTSPLRPGQRLAAALSEL